MSYLTQKTVKRSVIFSGVALHSGVNVNVTIKPADPNFGIVEEGKTYAMRLRMYRSMNRPRATVVNRGKDIHDGATSYFPPQDIITEGIRETFTMYSRPSAFGPPTRGHTSVTQADTVINPSNAVIHNFGMPGRFSSSAGEAMGGSTNRSSINMDSEYGYNFPFTPPYYHGEAWCQVTFTPTSDSMTIKEIQASASYEYSRFDHSFVIVTSSYPTAFKIPHPLDDASFGDINSIGPQSYTNMNRNAVQLSASMNINGIGTIKKDIWRQNHSRAKR